MLISEADTTSGLSALKSGLGLFHKSYSKIKVSGEYDSVRNV